MKNFKLLLVEDNEGDIMLISEALHDHDLVDDLTILRNGQEALEFVYQKGAYQQASRPDLILLDINLPKLNGHQVLKTIKEDKDLKAIPVILLSTSSAERDISQAYQNGANCFITKPMEMDLFKSAFESVAELWSNVVKLPQKEI
ncbi:response regulator [Dyadobacter tibetensis]|uniref:response regulator n=1 Tax=Dyadobacter tibetensis TaxID=1211851 RepID=UPI00046F3CE3|nr:response regulator [Dyadobacter tibetensis]